MSDLINKLIEDKSNSLPHTSSEIKHIVDISQSDTSCDVMVHGTMIKTKENFYLNKD